MTAHLETQSIAGTRGTVEQIESWLLHSDIQIDDGPERGGIAGWLDADGAAEFVYPEITGYYLTTMAWLASGAASSPERADIARFRARRAACWLADLLSTFTHPPTRLFLSEAGADWRNDAVFSFDIAMAARGIGSIGEPAHRDTLTSLCAWLNRISAGTTIMRSHELAADRVVSMPDRWSTRSGPHHLKAAAAVLRVGESAAGQALTAIAHRTCWHWAAALRACEWPCGELHALLYGLEGMLIADAGTGDHLDDVALAFTRLMMELQTSEGTLPETTGGGIVRSDVQAQALRIGMVLRGRGYFQGAAWADRIDALAQALTGFVRPDGGVLFAMDQRIANTWCAMFAHQALYLHARRHGPDPVPDTAFQYLV